MARRGGRGVNVTRERPGKRERFDTTFFTADNPHHRVCLSGLAGRAADL